MIEIVLVQVWHNKNLKLYNSYYIEIEDSDSMWLAIGIYASGLLVVLQTLFYGLKKHARRKKIILYNSSQTTCPICYDTINTSRNIVITSCGHRFCFGCLLEHCLRNHDNYQQPSCPVCREKINDPRWNREIDRTRLRQRHRIILENLQPLLRQIIQINEIHTLLTQITTLDQS